MNGLDSKEEKGHLFKAIQSLTFDLWCTALVTTG